jgi:cytosine/adenosine deaminase-related metal-dependent hydrolase
MSVRIVCADAIVLGEEPPLRDGAVIIEQDGRIVDVGLSRDLLARYAGAPIESVRGVLLPGLVNAHAHVEISALRGKVQGGAGFVPWVERMIAARRADPPEQDDDAIERAAAELEAFGTVAIGEVTNSLAAVRALAGHGIGGIVFHEVFGLERAQALERISKLESDAAAPHSGVPAPDFAYAPAPHTVYTTHPDAVRAILQRARELGVNTTVHLAEHAAERTFLQHGSGPFFDFASRMRFPVESFPVPGKGPVQVAAELGLLAPDVVLVHLTDARPDELDLIAQSGAPVVLCPRSNLFIEVKLPPLTEMLRAGIVPALGTDSLASNLSLDVLAEAKALGDRFPQVPKAMLLRMATAAGADALGRPDLGRIAKGKRPGVLIVYGELRPEDDPAEFVLQRPATHRRWINHRPLSLFPSIAPLPSKAPVPSKAPGSS